MLTVINASAAVTLLGQRPEKNSGSERDLTGEADQLAICMHKHDWGVELESSEKQV